MPCVAGAYPPTRNSAGTPAATSVTLTVPRHAFGACIRFRMKAFTYAARRLPRILRKGRIAFIVGFATLLFILPQATRFGTSRALSQIDDALGSLEKRTLDYRFRWRGPLPANPDIAIIGLHTPKYEKTAFRDEDYQNSEALQLMAERTWPWNRKVMALLVERLMQAGVRAIAFDFIFVGDNEGDPELCAVLAKYADRIVIATGTLDNNAADGSKELVFLRPNPRLLGDSMGKLDGFVTLHPDDDQVVRRVDYQTSELREHGLSDDARDVSGLAARVVEKATGEPVLGEYGTPINFQGRRGTYKHLPIEELFIDWIYQTDPRFYGGWTLKDKIVFVGPFAEIFHDVHNTPFGVMPGVEIHAQIAGDLLSGTNLRYSSTRQNWWVSLAFFVLATVIVILIRQPAVQFGMLLGLGISFIVLAQFLFTETRIIIPMMAPLFGLVGVGGFGLVYHAIIEQLEKSRIRSVLDRYVSKNVAKLVVESSDSFENTLRGERKSATVLFSDIRGFTTIFETAEPEQLVAQINEYFLEMVDAVTREDGTLLKFIGDAIMAAWGDIISIGHAGDAARAVRTSLLMREALVGLNARWKTTPDRVPLQIGIGVNHGEVIVGEFGHPDRMEFTVLGDAINVAARLESATKQFGCDILVGELAEKLTRSEFIYRHVGRVRFFGKSQPVEVYTPLSVAAVGAPGWLADYHQAIEQYRLRDFVSAAAAFKRVNEVLGGADFLCGMYALRCEQLAITPPGPDWDSSHSLTEK